MAPVSSLQSTQRARGTRDAPSLKSFLSLDRQTLLLSLVLIVAVLACYSHITHNEYVGYDDFGYIKDNPHVQSGLTWETVKWAFLTNDQANWHPLTWLSHALDYELFGLNPAGSHWGNVLLHALNAVLLFLLLQSATGCRWRSLMVAALFALHPINVESVAWAAERKNVLSMLFFLLALYAYVWYARRPDYGRYAAVAGFFTLALLAKPQVITFPFLLLLFDYWPLRRMDVPGRPAPVKRAADQYSQQVSGTNFPKFPASLLLWEKVPLLLLSAASAVVTVMAQSSGGAVKDLAFYSLPLRLETSVISYLSYIGKALWPTKLAALYPHPTHLYPAWQVGAAVFLLLLFTALVFWRAREQRYLAVGWFWFLGSLVPMIGLVQVGEQALADRYAYLTFIGLYLILVWLVAEWAGALRISTRWLAAPAGACLLALGILTYRQVSYWHDTESFWRRTIAVTQGNYIAHRDLAALLHEQGRNAEAIPELQAALAIRPDDLLANMYLGAHEHSQGNLKSAAQRFQLVAQRATKDRMRAQANTELGTVYRQMGRLPEAKQCFETSLKFVPNQPTLRVTLGVMAQKSGDMPEAVRQFNHAAGLQHSDVYELLLAQALRIEGRWKEADAVFMRASQQSPDLAAAQKTVETILAQ